MPHDPFILRVLFKMLRPDNRQANLYKWLTMPCVPLYCYIYWGRAYLTNWQVFLGGSLLLFSLNGVAIVGCSYLTERTFRHYPEPKQWFQRIGVLTLALWLTIGGGTAALLWLADFTHLFGYRYSPLVGPWIVVSVLVGDVIVAALLEVNFAFNQWQTNQLGWEQLEHQQLRSQLEEVKQQISPHFLFNSLNSLSVLIGEDARQAEQFVDELAKVYRYLLQVHRTNQHQANPLGLTTLAAELRYIASYAYLLRTRYGAALELHIAAGEAHRGGSLLPLTLQTLVDNAIRHNVASVARPLRIAIDTTVAGEVRVHNTCQKRSVRVPLQQDNLATLQARYQQLGSAAPAIAVEAGEHCFTVAIQLIAD